jgi:PAS domain-containing protein
MIMTARAATLQNYAASHAEAADAAPPDAAAQLVALRSIVDDLDYGIVVLDAARKVRFVNRTFRKFWRVPDEVAEGRPDFIKRTPAPRPRRQAIPQAWRRRPWSRP